MGKRFQRGISLILAVVMLLMAFPAEAIANNMAQLKFQRVEPPIFNPNEGETVRILWNFEYQHKTTIEVWSGVNLVCYIISPDNPKTFPGGFVTNEYIWDGTDENGQVLPNGTYTILIDSVDDEWAGRFPSKTKVTIMDSISEDMAIAPNVNGSYFTVYGSAEEENPESISAYTESVSVFIDGRYAGDADIKPGMWTLEVPLPEYEEVEITAIKVNMVPQPTGEVDELGQPIIELVPEEIELGPINVLKHTIRPYDKLPKIAEYYYGDSDAYTDIIDDNELSEPYLLAISANLLIFDPEDEGEPPISEFADPDKMDEKCGIIDLLSGKTEFSEDPVNLATGNFIYSYQDISIGGSFPISFNRYYNSRDRYNGDLGMNWHHNWEYRLQDMGDGDVKIIFYDGHRELYTLKENGEYESPAGIYSELEKHRDQTYTLTMENDWKYNFNERGELTSIVDSNSNTTELTYEDMLLSEIRNDSGYLIIQYYNNGQIRKISDNSGRYVSYTYDGYDLETFRDAEGNVIEYQYDSDHRMTGIISPLKDGSVTNLYDHKGRVIEQTLANGSKMYFDYDEENRTTTLTERDGSQIAYKYDESYRITEIIYPDGAEKMTFNEKGERTSYTDKKGNTYIYGYDDFGNVESVTDPMGNITKYTYEEHRITSVTQPDGKVYKYEYDSKGNLIKTIDPLNRTIEMRYNVSV